MAATHQLSLLLVLLFFKTGFSDEIPVFVKTGDSVQLDIQTQEPTINFLSWENEISTKLVSFHSAIKEVTLDSFYKERVEFNTGNFSLTLKNMQESDSGVYRATAIIRGAKRNVTAYRVSVIDAVEAPVLMINSNRSSSDSCTVNFTCRTQNLMINSSYQNNRCSPEEVTSHENYTLILHCSEESIICNYSNPVSWRRERRNIKDLCDKETDNPSSDGQTKTAPVLAHILIPVVLAIVIIISVVLSIIKCKRGAKETENNPQNEIQEQKREEAEDRIDTTYCMVGEHQKPTVNSETEMTLYSTVCKQPDKKQPTVQYDDA